MCVDSSLNFVTLTPLSTSKKLNPTLTKLNPGTDLRSRRPHSRTLRNTLSLGIKPPSTSLNCQTLLALGRSTGCRWVIKDHPKKVKTDQVEHLATPFGSETETSSTPLTGSFTTRPLAPTNFRVDEDSGEVAWVASPSPSVSTYKVRWKSTEEGSKPEEVLIPAPEDPNNCRISLKVSQGGQWPWTWTLIRQSSPGPGLRGAVQGEHLRHRGGLWNPRRVQGVA